MSSYEIRNQVGRRHPPRRREPNGNFCAPAAAPAIEGEPELPATTCRQVRRLRGGAAGAFALPAFGLTSWLAVFVVILSAFHASAADRFLLKPAVVHTISGASITNGSVLIEGDKIIAVGATVVRVFPQPTPASARPMRTRSSRFMDRVAGFRSRVSTAPSRSTASAP